MYKKIFFSGIGGIGMSALARYYLSMGAQIYGSDINNSELIENLVNKGVKVKVGIQDGEYLDETFDAFIYTVAISEDNREFIKAKNIKTKKENLQIEKENTKIEKEMREKENIKIEKEIQRDFKENIVDNFVIMTYAEALGEMTRDKKTIAISGTHGKTTTTAMTYHALKEAGLNVAMIIGSLIENKNMITGELSKTNYVSHVNIARNNGQLDYIIIEACEYKRSFLNYNPEIILITNIEADHLDYYKNLSDIENAFQDFTNKLPENGLLILHNEENKILNFKNKISADDISLSDIELSVPGEHNKNNARLVVALGQALGLDNDKVKKGLKDFPGTWRRQEYKGERWGYICYDDYAHHPRELEVTIKAFRDKFKNSKNNIRENKKITIAFMPHLYSRTKLLFNDFVKSLALADKIILLPIYAAREKADATINSEMLAEAIKEYCKIENSEKENLEKENSKIENSEKENLEKENKSKEIINLNNIEALKNYLENNNGNNDVFITFGAGDIDKIYKI